MNRALAAFVVALFPAVAAAHVSVISGPAFAGKNQEITFGVGHGCEGADTVAVRIEIPAEVATVRPLPSAFGALSVERDATDRVVAVSWQKADADVLDGDEAYYALTMRIAVPNAPFTRVYFPARQTCRTADGTTLSTDWIALPGGEGEAAPELVVVPARQPGWNKLTVPVAVDALEAFFADALIVWKGEAAWSSNPQTTAQIANTPGVSALSKLAAGDEIWVRY